MKTFRASIEVMPHDDLLEPQGRTVSLALAHGELAGLSDVRIGKHITLRVEAADTEAAQALVDKACRELLANKVMEKYAFTVVED